MLPAILKNTKSIILEVWLLYAQDKDVEYKIII